MSDPSLPESKPAPKPKAAPAPEPVYTRAELMAAAPGAFGVTPETVAGALRLAGLTTATKAQAAAAIKRFQAHRV